MRVSTTVLIALGTVGAGTILFVFYKKKQDQERSASVARFSEKIKTLLSKEGVQTNFYGTQSVGPASSKKLSTTQANAYAKKIWNAWGVFDDDENAIMEVLRACGSIDQVHQVAKAYETLYKVSLVTSFNEDLSDSERAEMDEIMKIKPLYI